MDEREQSKTGGGPPMDRAAESRRNAGATDAPAERGSGEDEGVLTLVCFKCGNEYYFAEGAPPPELKCEKCGNGVFRSFFSPRGDEVTADFEESTDRDLDPDDAEGDSSPGDVLDLNSG